jgi:hypothetical protein
MDKRREQLATKKILRRFSKRLQGLGFSQSKSSFFTRPAEHLIEFIHVHKYSFDSDFRVHFGLRVLTDPFEAVALNGPDSHDAVCRNRYDFHFDESDESIEECAESLVRFCAEDGEAWFKSWRDLEKLLQDQDSPLGPDAKKTLACALSGRVNDEHVARSLSLLPAS